MIKLSFEFHENRNSRKLDLKKRTKEYRYQVGSWQPGIFMWENMH